jgi:SH3-like domain-containing protein
MHAEADATSRLLWRLEPGVTGKLGDCEAGWCKFELEGGRSGYVEQARLWGAEELKD